MRIQEIYTRMPTDPNFTYGVLHHSNQIESIVSKIKMILNTRPGTILGDINFGIGIEDLIFETKINKTQIEEKIKTQILQYIVEASEYAIIPKVSFAKTEGYDIALIDIYIDDNKVAGFLIK